MMRHFLIALQFLTILPVKISAGGGSAFGGKPEIKERDFGKSLLYFPIVGMLIGLVLVLTLFVFRFLPSVVTAALILAISIVITGGIHLDGFADTCDGFYGGKSKEEILEIMRDSNMGAIGVIGIVTLLLLKFALFYSIPLDQLWKALILMAVGGRFSQVLSCSGSGYAREEGKAKFFVEYATKRELFFSAVFTFVLSVFLMKLGGIIIFILVITTSLSFIHYIKTRIGGMTGDTIGAISETAEVAVLLFALIFQRIPCF